MIRRSNVSYLIIGQFFYLLDYNFSIPKTMWGDKNKIQILYNVCYCGLYNDVMRDADFRPVSAMTEFSIF
jgi:hypothetical protein